MPEPTLKAPKHLKAATRRWWLAVATDWDLEQHHPRLLTLAAEAWDDKGHAREQIGKEGMTGDDAIWRATAATLSRPPSSCWRGGHAVAGRGGARRRRRCAAKNRNGASVPF